MLLRALLLLILASALGCGKSGDTSSAKGKVKSPTDGWLVYEDDMFRAQYPPGSDVVGAYQGKQDSKSPNLSIVPPPHSRESVVGGLVLLRANETQGMLLRDAIQNEISTFKGPSGILVSPPRDFAVKNGKCIGAIVMSPTSNCPKDFGSCFAPLYLTQCDAPKGARYSASTVLSVGRERDSLSPQALQEAAVYERILRSLEFKKS